MKIKDSFWGSWCGIGFGILLIIIGIAEIESGDLTTLDGGVTTLFASLAYRSIKRRRLGMAQTTLWRIGGETLLLAYVGIALAIDLNTPKYVYENPFVLLIPTFGIIAYLVAYFGHPIDSKEVKPKTKTMKSPKSDAKHKGIGGWLTLVALGLLFAPVSLAIQLLGTYLPILTDGTLQVLIDPSSAAYHPLWAPLLIFEIVGNLLMFLGACYLLFVFFKRSQTFPKSYIFVSIVSLIFVTIDFFAADLIPAVAEQDDSEMLGQLIRAIVGSAVWIPYMLKSERVKATFVEPYSDRIYTFFSSILSRFGNANT
ncbi:MAG: DUF2569 domain-containing protein [Candidatus Peribacteraceae bacterium]|nr:DUF2569 domain-containing protein [Candidatus Peribacteraceae bacterium]